jgi:hypothetical protein
MPFWSLMIKKGRIFTKREDHGIENGKKSSLFLSNLIIKLNPKESR